jgi:hypothetical protein
MKVLDLQCAHAHVFEGWFGSEGDFQDQLSRGLVQCPLCGDAEVTKRLSAPRLNFGKSRESHSRDIVDVSAKGEATQAGAPANTEALAVSSTVPSAEQAIATAWMAMTRKILANTQDVGDKFAEEARKIHYGETKERGIRGKATPDETQELIEEGIAVMPFFVPDALKEPLQ